MEVVVQGASHLAEQPEFSDLEKLHRLLRAIEDKEIVLQLIDLILEEDGVRVMFGSEHRLGVVSELTCVGGACAGAEQPAAISLLGPTRMDYGRLIPLVGYATQLFSHYWGRR
jgi:heat-inducible transcriptional repressor